MYPKALVSIECRYNRNDAEHPSKVIHVTLCSHP